MTVNANQAKLSLLLPALINPATAAAIGLGIVAVGFFNLLGDDDEEDAPKLIAGPDKATVCAPKHCGEEQCLNYCGAKKKFATKTIHAFSTIRCAR
ncbi:hypothetical protein [Yoonia sediminilitoris]|uniref:Uncharacterized protein n=1 Tax=Yoonia sediminilitoris TaxID=1286148 RepID=A0A2T6K6I1_9RHOB|nr:hypothetical protein [Yoonia sediminilitoris]PUB10247.1 hypothetical protein C8N45_1209 [Yoonia sediminilitoris]RCW89755.1 hypothetical protein DFP92_1209 [Yoonia sediminilitoris]